MSKLKAHYKVATLAVGCNSCEFVIHKKQALPKLHSDCIVLYLQDVYVLHSSHEVVAVGDECYDRLVEAVTTQRQLGRPLYRAAVQ